MPQQIPPDRVIEFVGRDGNRLAADVAGDPADPPVSCCTAAGRPATRGERRSARSAAKGWRAYAVDLRGHGESEWAADGDYTLDAFAGDVLAISRRARRAAGARRRVARRHLVARRDRRAPRRARRACARARRRRAPHGGAGPDAHRRVHGRAHGRRLRVARRGRRRDPALQPAPAAPVGSRRPAEEPAPRRRRPLVLALGSGVHRRPARRRRRDPRRRSSTRSASKQAARGLTVPTLLVRGRVSDLLSEEGAQELLELVPHAQLVDVAGAGHMVAGDRNDLFNDAVVHLPRVGAQLIRRTMP